ncbi:hypothetical protein [Paraburkholderia sp. BCC1885]|uniref:hypothetical protein n=1 Tax=Paraburkholderia sp. BCC1885 TaxID=2562669 RepID=UPI001182DCD4|nr:hypothetical protein [Paraburkholderia sp. BCC1885]
MSHSERKGARFRIGKPAITPAAQAALDESGIQAVLLLARHVNCDWGYLSVEDLAANELALLTGKRLLSSYDLPDGPRRVWIITEADRSVTTILLPEEY